MGSSTFRFQEALPPTHLAFLVLLPTTLFLAAFVSRPRLVQIGLVPRFRPRPPSSSSPASPPPISPKGPHVDAQEKDDGPIEAEMVRRQPHTWLALVVPACLSVGVLVADFFLVRNATDDWMEVCIFLSMSASWVCPFLPPPARSMILADVCGSGDRVRAWIGLLHGGSPLDAVWRLLRHPLEESRRL